MRLVKYLAHSGVASRRGSEEIIASGRVMVDGKIVMDPAHAVDDNNYVKLDGRRVRVIDKTVVYALNKPAGVVSTASDPQQRRTVCDLINERGRLYPVGRLDVNTTGLILLTNDGELANLLTHPRFGVPKTYLARIAKQQVSDKALGLLCKGVKLEDGRTAPAKVRVVKLGRLELTIREGRKHQVRRMFEAVGYPVRSLTRIRIGPLRLGSLSSGQFRRLSPAEVADLKKAAEL